MSKKESSNVVNNHLPRLKDHYLTQVAPALRAEFSYDSPMQTPKLVKIVLSVGVGESANNKKILDTAVAELTQITGLRAVRTKARKSIAAFKIRQGMEIGAMVTLRGNHMYEFFDRLVSVAIPRIKDFRGCNVDSFDGHGNYAMGVNDQTIFPEIDYDRVEQISGLNIAFVTTAISDRESRSLLSALGMPFQRPEDN